MAESIRLSQGDLPLLLRAIELRLAAAALSFCKRDFASDSDNGLPVFCPPSNRGAFGVRSSYCYVVTLYYA